MRCPLAESSPPALRPCAPPPNKSLSPAQPLPHQNGYCQGSWTIHENAGSPAKLSRHQELSLPKTEPFLLGRSRSCHIVRRLAGSGDSVAFADELFVEALAVDVAASQDAAVDAGLADHVARHRALIDQDLEGAHRRRPTLPDFAVDRAILLAHHRVDAEEHNALAVDLDYRGIDRLGRPGDLVCLNRGRENYHDQQ